MLFSLLRQGYTDPKMILFVVLLYFLALSLAFAGHEYAHALVAHLLGDNTAKNMGRLTLNPLAHTDLRGVVILILLGFGWGKPVPINPANFHKIKSRKLGIVLVSLAGITANLLMAFVSSIVCCVLYRLQAKGIATHIIFQFIMTFFDVLESLNVCLLVFNLIPIPPLDGFKLIDTLLPVRFRYTGFYRGYCHYAPLVFFAIILITSFSSNYSIISGAVNIVRLIIDLISMLITSFI